MIEQIANKSSPHADFRCRVIVAVCTYNRNDALRQLLTALAQQCYACADEIAIGVVVVDDSEEQLAKALVESFEYAFELGTSYRHSGARNISKARNLSLNTAMQGDADWVAMTDDDCEPCDNWLHELLTVQASTGAHVVTGPLVRRAPSTAPKWLKTQPFLQLSSFNAQNGSLMDTAFTNNSMISAEILRSNPQLRFDPEFGRIGGEDMVFYRSVARLGFKIVFAADALVFENEEESRLNLRYQLRRYFWMGNSSTRTSIKSGISKPRLALHGAASLARAAARPAVQLLRGRKPQFLYGLAVVCEAFGKLSGVAGIKINHK